MLGQLLAPKLEAVWPIISPVGKSRHIHQKVNSLAMASRIFGVVFDDFAFENTAPVARVRYSPSQPLSQEGYSRLRQLPALPPVYRIRVRGAVSRSAATEHPVLCALVIPAQA